MSRPPDEAMAVSVLVVTYNHASFVRQALDSALAQRLPQPFEILISEDRSTDGTREIVQEYAERHPEIVRLLLSERNLCSNEVVARGFRSARGRYVALLDGDDYWTGADKLQAQVEILDARPDMTICFHNVQVVDEGSRSLDRLWNGSRPAGAVGPARALTRELHRHQLRRLPAGGGRRDPRLVRELLSGHGLAAARPLRPRRADRLHRPNPRGLPPAQRRVVLDARRTREARGERRLLPAAARTLLRSTRDRDRTRTARLLPRLGRGVSTAW